MRSLAYHPPVWFKKYCSEYQWDSCNNQILLSFDDGPTAEVLPLILDFLDRYALKAIFFVVGNNVANDPDLAKEIIAKGHTLGNHTQNHRDIWFCRPQFSLKEIDRGKEAILSATSTKCIYFRPPHGRFDWRTSKFLAKTDQKGIMWSLLTADYTANYLLVKQNIIKYIQANSIVTFHDNSKAKPILVDCLELLYETASNRGLSFGTPQDCLT